MDDAALVRGLQPGGDLKRDAGHLPDRQTPLAANVVLERDALHQFHDDEIDRALNPDIIDVHDVRVGKTCRCLRLHAELRYKLRIVAKLRLEHLDGNKAIQPVVLCLVDIGHPARSYAIDYLISILKRISCI